MRDQILAIIKRSISEENELLESPIDLSAGESTPLYSHAGHLDSMGLVSLVVAVEQAIQATLRCRVTLANNRAMSAHGSPFATLGSFTDYVLSQVNEASRV
jgi:acyl carrier protein